MYAFIPQYLAQVRNPVLTSNFQSFRGYDFFNEIMPNIVLLALIIGATYFFFVLITGAIAWISSGGDKQKVEDARKRITSAITGLIILLLIFAFTQLLNLLFGINIGDLGTGPGGPTRPPSTVTPTQAPVGSCSCQSWAIDEDNCIPPEVAECEESSVCECRSPGFCYDPNVDYWRGCSPDPPKWPTCTAPRSVICDPPTSACSSFIGAGAQCCVCNDPSDPHPTPASPLAFIVASTPIPTLIPAMPTSTPPPTSIPLPTLTPIPTPTVFRLPPLPPVSPTPTTPPRARPTSTPTPIPTSVSALSCDNLQYSINPPVLNPGQTANVQCDFGGFATCIAPAGWSNCTWTGWIIPTKIATFTCDAPSSPGTYQNYCETYENKWCRDNGIYPISCSAGTYVVCQPEEVICSGACVDTSSDNFNCGGCNNTCAPSEVCMRGRCT